MSTPRDDAQGDHLERGGGSTRPGSDESLVPRLVPVGAWDPALILRDRPGTLALFVQAGSITREHVVSGRTVSDLLGPGDVISLSERLIPPPLPRIDVRFTVLEEAHVVVLDDEAVRTLCRRPEFAADMIVLAADHASRLAAMRALSHLPRVEQRVLAFFSVMAERAGRVTPDGLVVPLALSHEELGRHVGAQRSTISLALKWLADEGLLVRTGRGSWLMPEAHAGEPIDVSDVAPQHHRPPSGPPARPVPDAGSGLDELRARVIGLRRQYDRARSRIADYDAGPPEPGSGDGDGDGD